MIFCRNNKKFKTINKFKWNLRNKKEIFKFCNIIRDSEITKSTHIFPL